MSYELDGNLGVCPSCGYHSRISSSQRLSLTADKNSFVEYDADMISKNPIEFPGYEQKQLELREKTGLRDAVITGECTIRGRKCVIGIMDTRYMMASMGSVVGEKITRAFEKATEKHRPTRAGVPVPPGQVPGESADPPSAARHW
ncbi:MAG: hypothetical protein IIU25_01325 [Oscillospiraceae bacterium]|nr:hypothetical protein [Oscillospiraceae bacterium]